MLFQIRQGDRIPLFGPFVAYDPVLFTVVDLATYQKLILELELVPVDFSTYTLIEFEMVHVDDGTAIGGPAVGTSGGELTYAWKVGDTDKPGTYRGLFRVWDAAGRPQSLPSQPITVIVAPR